MSFLSLVYISDATQDFTESELQDLLAVCRTKNQANDITGMMIYAGGKFLQILEGDPVVVHELVEKLEMDPRHTHLIVMASDLVDRRHFNEWSMGFKATSAERVARELPGFVRVYDGDKLELKNKNLRSMNINILLQTFIRIVQTEDEINV